MQAMDTNTQMIKIGLGGGCHWCTEAVFQALAGVTEVDQGFCRSIAPDEGWSEAVMVTFDPDRLPMAALVEVHLRTHASQSAHSMRGKYRSAVYCVDDTQLQSVSMILKELAPGFDQPLVTRPLLLSDFKLSDSRFHDYYRTDPQRPFCQTYIDPKLALLKQRFGEFLPTGKIN